MQSVIIKNLLHNPEYFRQTFPFLKSTHFESTEYQHLFDIIKNYYNNYKTIPSNKEMVLQIKSIKNKDIQHLVSVAFKDALTTKSNINDNFLRDKTEEYIKNKEFFDFMLRNAEQIQKGEINTNEALYDIQEINKISLSDSVGIDYNEIEKRIEYYKQKIKGIKTGLSSIDKILGGGFREKTLNIIAAPSGVGKSLFGSSIASNMLVQGYNVLVVTLEMSDFEYLKRVDANVLDLDINSFSRLEKQVILNKFNEIKDKIGRLKSIEYPSGRFSALQLENLLDNLKNTEDFIPDIIVIDYLALMKSDRYSTITNSNSYYTSVAEDVRAISQARGTPILSFSQLVRGTVNTSEFTQDSISLAKGIYETADTFFFLVSNPDMKENGEIGIIPDKNRNTGITNKTIMLGIDYSKMRVYDDGIDDNYVSGFDMVESNEDRDLGLELDLGTFKF